MHSFDAIYLSNILLSGVHKLIKFTSICLSKRFQNVNRNKVLDWLIYYVLSMQSRKILTLIIWLLIATNVFKLKISFDPAFIGSDINAHYRLPSAAPGLAADANLISIQQNRTSGVKLEWKSSSIKNLNHKSAGEKCWSTTEQEPTPGEAAQMKNWLPKLTLLKAAMHSDFGWMVM